MKKFFALLVAAGVLWVAPSAAEPIVEERGQFGEWSLYCTVALPYYSCSVGTATESDGMPSVWVKVFFYYPENDIQTRDLHLVFHTSPEGRVREKLHFSILKNAPNPRVRARIPHWELKQVGLMNLPQTCGIKHCEAKYLLSETGQEQLFAADELFVLVGFQPKENAGFYFSIPHLKRALDELQKIVPK